MSGLPQHSVDAAIDHPARAADAPRSTARVDVRAATADRILDGAERALGRKGARATSMEDVAREAGVTRMTVYRYYASREQLMSALTEREMGRYYARVFALSTAIEAETAPGESPARRICIETIQLTVGHFTQHPIIHALVENDPDLILPMFTTHGDVVLRAAVAALSPAYARWVHKGWIRPLPPEWIAEWVTRLCMSWHITPSPLIDPHDPETIRRLVETFIWPVLEPTPGQTPGE